MKNFTAKYKPLKSSDIPQDISILKESILKKECVLLGGPPGSCKTSSVYAIANELNYEVLELNASDVRNKDQIEKIIANAIKQVSLFKKGKIILIDEVDGINKLDYGGLPMLISLL